MASAFGKRDQLYSARSICRETGGVCPQICLPDSGFGVKFKRLGRRGWHAEMLGASSIYVKVLNIYNGVLDIYDGVPNTCDEVGNEF